MSQENVEIVRRAFEAFNQDGADAFTSTSLWSPETVLDASRTGIPGIGIYRGIDEVKAFFEQAAGVAPSLSARYCAGDD